MLLEVFESSEAIRARITMKARVHFSSHDSSSNSIDYILTWLGWFRDISYPTFKTVFSA